MNKLINKLFPLADQLYIYQLFEYENADFIKWFFKYPFKRGLQRKHTLVWTSKAKILFLVACFLIIFFSFASSITQFKTLLFVPFFFLLYSLFAPFFLVFSNLLFAPLGAYSKAKLIKSVRNKQSRLKDLKVVAIVGSYAKTSTKNMLYTLLWKDFYTVKTPKSYNTEVSIARSFLRDVKETTDIFIVEMDAYHPGEIKKLCSIIKPDLGIITAIGAQHLERFGSMETLAKTQFELAKAIPQNGLLFLNADDEWTNQLYPGYDGVKQVFFGRNEGKDIQATDIKVLTHSTEFTLRIKNDSIKIELPLAGENHAINFTAAAGIAYQLGVSLKTIQQRAALVLPTEHRLEVKKAGHITIIDNSYNTNPTAARASLKLLKSTPGSEKIVITPGLVELGEQSEVENTLLGEEIAKVADQVIVVGEFAKDSLNNGLKKAKFTREKIHFVSSTQHALNLVYSLAQKEAVILIENDLPDQYF
jgi:UDP-N-acetylmuramoyl-tripeptide--D-alanyl-D-alanine ligase